jgi:hypothetical protein
MVKHMKETSTSIKSLIFKELIAPEDESKNIFKSMEKVKEALI